MKVFTPKWLPASLPALAVGVRPTAAGRQTFALLRREAGWGYRVVAHTSDLPLREVREVSRALARESRWYEKAYPRRGYPRLAKSGFEQSRCACGDCVRVTIGRLLAPMAPDADSLLQARASRPDRAARLKEYAEWVANGWKAGYVDLLEDAAYSIARWNGVSEGKAREIVFRRAFRRAFPDHEVR